MKKFLVLVWVACFLTYGCDNNELPATKPGDLKDSELKGTGSYIYSSYIPLREKPVRVHYHIPSNADERSPILFAFHGASRDGQYTRDVLAPQADRKGVILIVPEFSTDYYPGGNEYNLGNLFENGENPSLSSLNAQEIWTFTLIKQLFLDVKAKLNSSRSAYGVLGFSAGSQFAHRLSYFSGDAIERAAFCSAGWYTLMDDQIEFPYGTGLTPFDPDRRAILLGSDFHVLVGALDNDPNASSLRRNEEADEQGTNRYDRANFYFNTCNTLAAQLSTPFNWDITVVPGVSHELSGLAYQAFEKLYP